MAARYFVFVEFKDPKVRELLTGLQKSLSEKPIKDVPHVTVRGPYTTPPDREYLVGLSESLEGQGVLIADVGMFTTPKGYAVFLHAKSRIFDDVWWKPDFRGPINRRIPHVTIYETVHHQRAATVVDFLRSEAIEIVTFGVELTVYTSKQHTLLEPSEHLQPVRRRFPQERMYFKAGLLERAASLRKYLKAQTDTDGGQQPLL